jgi:hypothetical protein
VDALHVVPHTLLVQVALPLPALGPLHMTHPPPLVPVPHSLGLCAVVTHPFPSQHPPAHDALLHAMQVPAWQTCPVPHGLPSSTLTGLVHWGPVEQDCVPSWHWLPPGLHWAPAEQATQLPLPSHTPLPPDVGWHDTPAAAGEP